MRKPREKPDPYSELIEVRCADYGERRFVDFYKGSSTNDPGYVRDLAAWLLMAADWLEGEK